MFEEVSLCGGFRKRHNAHLFLTPALYYDGDMELLLIFMNNSIICIRIIIHVNLRLLYSYSCSSSTPAFKFGFDIPRPQGA